MKEIPLTQGRVALVDDEDYEWLSEFKWFAVKQAKNYYAACKLEGRTTKMHRIILGITNSKILVDHENCNGLDNQKHNLRLCTHQQNMCNQNLRSTNTIGLKGVYRHIDGLGWCAQISVNGRRIHLGTFNTPEEAAQAYNISALEHHKEFARLNQIPDGTPPLTKFRLQSNNTSGFLGVRIVKNRYRAVIKFNKKTYNLGTYDMPEEAARAYNQKAVELLGDKAKLNIL